MYLLNLFVFVFDHNNLDLVLILNSSNKSIFTGISIFIPFSTVCTSKFEISLKTWVFSESEKDSQSHQKKLKPEVILGALALFLL